MEELFNKWLESKDTTENVINHLKGQKFFHLDFLKYVTEQCNIPVVVYQREMKYQDLMYFGCEWDADSKKNETDFIAEIKERFPNVELKDAYDSIKGYRQEVYLEESESDKYWAWIIAFGWLELSLRSQGNPKWGW